MSRDLHAILFKLGVDIQISHKSGMATDPFSDNKI